MKTYLVLAASAIATVAAPAFADTTASGNSSTISLSANVVAACGVGNHRSGATSGAGNTTDATYNLTADGAGQFKTAQTQNRSFGNVWCNGPATVSVEASQLSTPTAVADTSSFTNMFDVEVSGGAMIYVGGGTLATNGSATKTQSANLPAAFETGLGTYSSVDIKVLPALGSGAQPLRPVAGAYTGHVTITATVGA